MTEHEIDLHGLHPEDPDLFGTIEAALREAQEAGVESLRIIHGHGHNRYRERSIFAHTNTGYLGLTIRGILRNQKALRVYMLAKIDVSHDGSTVVKIRRPARPSSRA